MQIELRLYPVPASSRWPFSLVHSEELGNSKNFNETLALVLQSLFNSHPWMCFMKGEDSQTKVMEKAGYLGYLQKFAQESGSQSAA